MKKAISILLCIVLLAGFTACGAKSNPQENNSTKSEEDKTPIISNNISDSDDMMDIDSPIGKLYYPIKWKDDVVFQVTEDQVDASYDDIPLFTIYFGGEKGDVFETVERNGTEVVVRYELYEIDSSLEQFETVSSMQDDINVIFYYLIQGE